MALVSIPLCVLMGEYYAIVPFLWTALASLGSGQLLYRLFKKAEGSRLRHSLITVALGWGLIPCFSTIPFLLIASHLATTPIPSPTVLYFQEPWNALFEAFSGFTSTGLSMALHANELPRTLQWWRSFMEWIGGVGVIVLMVSLLEPSTDAYQLYNAEGRQQRIGLTVTETVRKIWWIYLLYTLASVIWLRVVGMPWWDALNHGMTGISTGGFAITDNSIAAYSPLIQAAVIPIMIAGAISFPVHYQLVRKGKLSALWQDTQHQAFWILLILGIGALVLEHYWFGEQFFWLDTIFQWASALGTCGFNTTDVSYWSPTGKLILTLGMIFGGASGSTVGGLKLTRVVSLFKAMLWRFQRVSLQPHQMMRYQLDGKVITEAEANRRIESAGVLTSLWLGAIALGVIVLLHVTLPQYSLSDIIFEAASALGSVGLSTGITHPNLSWMGKFMLIVLMWMGRLEIIPVLLLLTLPLGMLRGVISRKMHRMHNPKSDQQTKGKRKGK
ncbi:TrkH family potassium uptake protein [Coleofasciculus sp. LEGE 07081]|uniref:TrkH family potassium uptake protein n=1 Tax=unclassified Coleofasciculus TaxID=2692782 RepID=UPI0018809348|nr:TrkH family potassium uptake protein [Coleofasciculus sp. LEGE 07081]MBE9151960.1 TrkH family potassium uptake protein [Coleofasciculus sp. LEGE 07092]